MLGFVNIYKPKGITSHDVVARLRRVTKIKQIGHTGTLDPFAEGVLPICIGKATRLIEYLADDKAYIATVQFGKVTDTYDIEGKVVSFFDKKVTKEDVIKSLKNFEGEIEQIPPIYSAIKVNGKKLYEYARAGEQVEIKPRKVIIENIHIVSFDEASQSAEIYIKCSKGTYIRTIGYDLGKMLGCGAYLTKLVRVQAGNFLVEDSTELGGLENIEQVQACLISPIEKMLLEKVLINDVEYKRCSNGLQIYPRDNIRGLVSLVYNNQLIGVALADEKEIKVKKFIGLL